MDLGAFPVTPRRSDDLEPSMLDRLLREHAAGRRDHSATLWSLLMLDAFLRRMQQPATVSVADESIHAVFAAGASP